MLSDQVTFTKCRSQCLKVRPAPAFSVGLNSPLHRSRFPGLVPDRECDTPTPSELSGPGVHEAILEMSPTVRLRFSALPCHHGTCFSRPRTVSRQWREAQGPSPAIRWCLPPWPAAAPALARLRRCDAIDLPGLPALIFRSQGLHPLGPAWSQRAFHSRGSQGVQCPWLSPPLRHEPIAAAPFCPDVLRRRGPTRLQ